MRKLLITLLVSLCVQSMYAQELFKFGVNQIFYNGVHERMIKTESAEKYYSYDTFFTSYHVKYYRQPGGKVSRFYFWDDTIPGYNLASKASHALSKYYDSIGNHSQAEAYLNQTIAYSRSNYKDFLNYAREVHVKPVIVINPFFYPEGDTVYFTQVFHGRNKNAADIDMGLRPDRWDKITANLHRQLHYTHKILGEDSVCYWELGNEVYFLLTDTGYGRTIKNMVQVIKRQYPQDKIIFSFSKGIIAREDKDIWNKNFVEYLITNNLLDSLDYAALHYYYPRKGSPTYRSQDSINKAIRDNFFFARFMSVYKSYFAGVKPPKVALTEFSPIETTRDTNFNTQYNALTEFDCLLKFRADTLIAMALNQSGTGTDNGEFFHSSILGDSVLSTYVDTLVSTSQLFQYISPKGFANKIFFDLTGQTFKKYTLTSNYGELITTTGSGFSSQVFIQVLNYSNRKVTYTVPVSGATKKYVTYTLDDLTAHYWDINSNKKHGHVKSHLNLPGHSFTTIVIDKQSLPDLPISFKKGKPLGPDLRVASLSETRIQGLR